MDARIWMNLETKDRSIGGQAHKVIATTVALVPGMQIEDSAWNEPRPIKAVSFSTETPNTLTVSMGWDDSASKAEFRQTVEMYRGHGWTVKVAGE
jgi:hypothetical protein